MPLGFPFFRSGNDDGNVYCYTRHDRKVHIFRRYLLFPSSPLHSPPRIQAERLKLLEESLSGVPHDNRRPDSKFSSAKDGASGGGGGKSGQTTAAASEQQQQGVDSNGGVNAPGGEKSEGARGGEEDASDENVFEVLTVPDDKWISPDLPPEAGRQQQDNRAAGGGGGSSSGSSTRPGVGARGPQVGRPTGVTLTPQQVVGLHRVSQRRVN